MPDTVLSLNGHVQITNLDIYSFCITTHVRKHTRMNSDISTRHFNKCSNCVFSDPGEYSSSSERNPQQCW